MCSSCLPLILRRTIDYHLFPCVCWSCPVVLVQPSPFYRNDQMHQQSFSIKYRDENFTNWNYFFSNRLWRVCNKSPQGGSQHLFLNTYQAKLACLACSDSTDQLCDLFLSYFIDLYVMYLIMTAQLLCNRSFPHCRRPKQKDSDWLQKYMERSKGKKRKLFKILPLLKVNLFT